MNAFKVSIAVMLLSLLALPIPADSHTCYLKGACTTDFFEVCKVPEPSTVPADCRAACPADQSYCLAYVGDRCRTETYIDGATGCIQGGYYVDPTTASGDCYFRGTVEMIGLGCCVALDCPPQTAGCDGNATDPPEGA